MNIDSLDINNEYSQIYLPDIFNDFNLIEYVILIIIFIIALLITYKFFFSNNNTNNEIICSQQIIGNKNLLIILKEKSLKYPDYPALVIKKDLDWISVNYEDYYNNVKQFAKSANHWIGKGSKVAIIGFNSPAWYYAHLGCMANHGISIGIYPTNTAEMCEEIIKNCKPDIIVVEDDIQLQKFKNIKILKDVKLILYYSPISTELLEKFGSIPVVSFGVFMEESDKKIKKSDDKFDKLINNIDMNSIATIIYSSGTTNKSKSNGVIITHDNIMSMMTLLLNTVNNRKETTNFTIGLGERFVSYLPLNHVAGQTMDIYIPICVRGTVWFADKNALKNKNTLISTLKEARPTIFIGVPRVWEKITDQIKQNSSISTYLLPKFVIKNKILDELGLNECKYCITTGAPISEIAKNCLDSYDIPLYNMYGLSETSGPISVSLPNFRRNDSVGIPLDGLRVKINMDGEILVKGPSVTQGYYNNRKETDKLFERGWLKTGDLGKMDKGYLFIVGRKKELIITSGGENIAPVPIENNLLKELTDIEYAIVIGNNKKFLSVLLFPYEKYFDKYENIDNEMTEYYNNKITEINKLSQSNAHKIQKWKIILCKFTVGKELTPTYKIKRDYIHKKFNIEINSLYENE